MERKTRPNAVIKTLPEDLQAEISRRCQLPGESWKAIRAWLKSEHGLDVRSDTTLSDWLPWYRARQRAREREAKIQGLLDQEKRLNPQLTDEQLFSLGQRFFSELTIADEDAKSWAVVQRAAQAREDARFEREKFEFDAAEACLKHLPALRQIATNPKLSNNDRIQEIRKRLFGTLPEPQPTA